MLQHDGDKWDWVWLDSISLFQDVGLDDVYLTAVKAKESLAAQRERARYGPDRGEYRINMFRLEQMIRHWVGEEIFNLGVTAHPFWYTDPESDDANAAMMPWIQGKNMSPKICGYMNIVGYMRVKEVTRGKNTKMVRELHTNKTERYYAKCQFRGAFGEDGRVSNPTMPELVQAINAVRTPARRRRRTRREQRAQRSRSSSSISWQSLEPSTGRQSFAGS